MSATLVVLLGIVLLLSPSFTANAQKPSKGSSAQKPSKVRSAHKRTPKVDSMAPPSEGDFVDVTQEPVPTVPIEQLIHYPAEAARLNLAGQVVLDALISTKGDVEKVHVLKSTNPIFDSAAVDAIRHSTFSPALGADHKPVRLWLTRTITFKLAR